MEHEFKNVRELKRWLDANRWEAGSPEAYDQWLQHLFEAGNKVIVNGESYDYWACWELI